MEYMLNISWVSATNEWDIKFNMRRYIPNLQAAMYYFYYTDLLITFLTIFLKISENSLKFSEGHKNVSEQFPKIPKDYWRLLKDPQMFWLYTMRIWKICHHPGWGVASILRVVYFPVKHWCLYKKTKIPKHGQCFSSECGGNLFVAWAWVDRVTC